MALEVDIESCRHRPEQRIICYSGIDCLRIHIFNPGEGRKIGSTKEESETADTDSVVSFEIETIAELCILNLEEIAFLHPER